MAGKVKKSNSSKSIEFDPSLIHTWEEGLKRDKSVPKTFRSIELGLRSCLQALQELKEDQGSALKLDNSKCFNEVVKFCLSHVSPALHRLFKMNSPSDKPVKTKKTVTLNPVMRNYLKSLILLSRSMTDPSASEIIISKGILPLLPFYCENSKVAIALVKHLAHLWCTSREEKVQILAFIAIFRLTRSSSQEVLEHVMKLLYTSYARNSLFTSPNTLDTINFMRTSLVELYCLNQSMAYKLAFTYIRNMASHLRNAMITPKMDKLKIVYNWPFIHSIHFLGDLLAKTHPSPALQPLIYPWTQIALGTMTLQRSPKYFPLVFHLANILTEVSHRTTVFIPVLTPLLEVLQHKGLRMAPPKNSKKDTADQSLNWQCILKVSTSQIKDPSFTDGTVEQLYGCILSYLNVECSTIGFPELVFPAVVLIRNFLKSCKCPSNSKKMKQLLDKLQENSSFITQRRKDVSFGVADAKAVQDWEIATRQSDPPLHVFNTNWKQIRSKKTPKRVSNVMNAKSSSNFTRKQRPTPFETEERISYEDDQDEDDAHNTGDLAYSGPEDILGQYVPSDDEDNEDDYVNQLDEDSDDNAIEDRQPKKKMGKKVSKRPRKRLDAKDNAPPKKKMKRMQKSKKSKGLQS